MKNKALQKTCFLMALLLVLTSFQNQAQEPKAAPVALYDLTKDFATNSKRSSLTEDAFPVLMRSHVVATKLLLDYPLLSPIGVPACAIMNGKGIKQLAQAGFDVLTYKTVRSTVRESNPLPNIVYLDQKDPVVLGVTKTCVATDTPCNSTDQICIANSFGNPSFSLEWCLEDIKEARSALSYGQILIVSVFGSEKSGRSSAEDFAFLAKKVSEAGAHIVEANFSCPNDSSGPSLIYKDPETVYTIVRAMCEAAPNVPITIKVGVFDHIDQMKEVFTAAAKAGAKGICGINSIALQIVDKKGNPAFDTKRLVAGVSGNPIRDVALQFVKDARRIIQEENLNLILFATGGVTKPEHFSQFFLTGADVVLSGTGTMWNPHLAIEYHVTTQHQEFMEKK